MNYCTNCGNKVDSNAFVCIHCGVKLRNDISNNAVDKGGIGWGLLGFFVPVVGLILYLVWKNEKPNTAKSVGIGALIWLVIYIVIFILFFTFGFTKGINNIDYNDYENEYYYKFE